MQAKLEAGQSGDRLGIVLVAYGNADSIAQLLAYLSEEKRPGDRIVLVDNLPPHDCARIAEDVGAVDVVIRSENVGFGAGCNKGAAVIEDEVELLLFLNPDSTPERGAITRLREGGEEEWVAWSGLLLLPDGTINSAGNTVHLSGLSWCAGYGEKPDGYRPPAAPVALSGADLVVRSHVWKQLGGFAPDYFLYYEDTDLSFRLRSMGYELGIVHEARIAHDYKFDKSRQKWFYLERNRYLFILRAWPLSLLLVLLPLGIVTELGLWLVSVFQGRLLIRTRAVALFLRILPRLVKERRRISRQRVLSAYQCLQMLEPRIDTPLLPRVVRNGLVSAVFVGYYRLAALLLRIAARA
ncbi:MAG: glycosyltransferase family 2 protein [Gaiellaceae bacterium]|jgi:GT2 family glycosyltransferase